MCKSGKCDDQKENNLMMDLGMAPEFSGIAAWINLPTGQAGSNPLTMESLRGKVVLIDFWTYSCINCIRTQPYLNAWYEKYEKDWFVIIWVHAPEFAFEKVESNVREASKKEWIKYPIALDNDFKTWNAYGNRYWPAKYLIDQKGNIVYKHFWEGAYDETEKKIQELLGAKKDIVTIVPESSGAQEKTPETYLGTARSKPETFEVQGEWKLQPEYIEAVDWHHSLNLPFNAKKVYLVVSWTGKIVSQVSAPDLYTQKDITIDHDGIYTVFEGKSFVSGAHLTIFASPWLRLHAFTFWD